MLTVAEAHRLIATHLGDSHRARHSVFVGFAMRQLAGALEADAPLWEVTGLVHDLDFDAVAGDWSQHGILAATWLSGDLPDDALAAIPAHDHRTGIMSETAIARALKLADALAIVCDALGPEAPAVLAARDVAQQFAARFVDRPYLPRLLLGNAESLGIRPVSLAAIAASGPPSS